MMARAKAVLSYNQGQDVVKKDITVEYFLDSTLVSDFNMMHLHDGSTAQAEIICEGLNFELQIEQARPHITIGTDKYQVLRRTPYQGLGMSATIFIGKRVAA